MSLTLRKEGDADTDAERLGAIAQQLLDTLGAVRVVSLSFHDEDADVLWLTESVLGPDEHEAVRSSLEVFAGANAPPRHEYDLGDGRLALLWRASHGGGPALGAIMLIVDQRAASDTTLSARAPGPQLAANAFANWLADDLSATQLRMRALPDLSVAAPEDEVPLTLVDYVPPEPAKPEPARQAPVDPQLDRLFSALRAQPIELHAQRLEPLREGSRIRRYEVLLRTNSEHGRQRAPVAMLEAATKKGMGSVLDRRVITELFVWLARNGALWQAEPITVSVNLSPTALVDPNFLKFLELCLAKSGLPRGMIGFELDATLCARNAVRAAEFAEVLASLGCKLVLDDYSLQDGHTELLGLKGLRMLKLQARLTQGIAADTRRQAVVAGIAQMARMVGMYTCAKAVESAQEGPLLASLEVDFAQGYGYARPQPLADLAG